ncbi:MAG: hypothetical protein HYV07_16205 [Deltaproteobacteria bacterium]|nr:hypothetical protein [Deltaproteobacteria bacterium]
MATGAASGSTGCATLDRGVAFVSAESPAVGALINRLNEGLALIDRSPLLAGALGRERLERSASARSFVEKADPLATQALRALFIGGLFRGLPEELAKDPQIEAKKQALSPELDRTVVDLTRLLGSMTPADLRTVRVAIDSRPDAVMRVTSALDDHAERVGVPIGSRLRLRQAATEINFRLRKQPPELLIGQYVDKVQRLARASGGDLIGQQALVTGALEQSFWASAGGGSDPGPKVTSTSTRAFPSDLLPAGRNPDSASQEPSKPKPLVDPSKEAPTSVDESIQGHRRLVEQDEAERERERERGDQQPARKQPDGRGDDLWVAAAVVGGIGVTVFGISSAVVASGTFDGVFGMTVGAGLALIALILFIIGAVLNVS